jgi:hypothetical protein
VSDDSPSDLSVFDLARRLVDGLPVSAAGQREVAAELLRVQPIVEAAERFVDYVFVFARCECPQKCVRCDLTSAVDTARAKESR